MMATRDQIVAEAREWIDTKFHHQGRVKGVGADCVGVVIGVAQALEITNFDITGYPHMPYNGMFIRYCEQELDRIPPSQAQPGDLLIFAFLTEPQHIAILTQTDPQWMMVHSYAQVRKCVEHSVDDGWMRRLRAAYRFRGIE